jgi:hypothetical protein
MRREGRRRKEKEQPKRTMENSERLVRGEREGKCSH